MSIKLETTKQENHWVKMLCYGESGVGKTYLCQTAPKPVIISAERGLLTLADVDIPVIHTTTMAQAKEAYDYLKGTNDFQTICIDSISELAEALLTEFLSGVKDPRQAYGKMNIEVAALIRLFRNLPNKHVYFTAKQDRIIDEFSGKVSYMPGMPGKTILNNLPYFFDIVACLRVATKDKKEVRYLQTQPTAQYTAKDRSRKLNDAEEPNLTKLFNKVIGVK